MINNQNAYLIIVTHSALFLRQMTITHTKLQLQHTTTRARPSLSRTPTAVDCLCISKFREKHGSIDGYIAIRQNDEGFLVYVGTNRLSPPLDDIHI